MKKTKHTKQSELKKTDQTWINRRLNSLVVSNFYNAIDNKLNRKARPEEITKFMELALSRMTKQLNESD